MGSAGHPVRPALDRIEIEDERSSRPAGYGCRGCWPRRRPCCAPPPSRRRDESGLTTLEWLLIVAAVAGIAALAVVLVQGVVSDTSEQISGSSARRTAAEIAAAAVQAEAEDPVEAEKRAGGDGSDPAHWSEWERYYKQKCKRIEITYGDAGISITPTFTAPTGGTPTFKAVAALPNGFEGTATTDGTAICKVT